MPRKNVERYFENGGIYHVYSRGIARRNVFLDDGDFRRFTDLVAAKLSHRESFDKQGRIRSNFYGSVELGAYCLMNNHFHLLLRQLRPNAISDFMKSLLGTYSIWFNTKYRRCGSLFDSPFRALQQLEEGQHAHASRYIHRNPHSFTDFERYPYSSYKYFVGRTAPLWLKKSIASDLAPADYREFVREHQQHEIQLDEYKRLIAS